MESYNFGKKSFASPSGATPSYIHSPGGQDGEVLGDFGRGEACGGGHGQLGGAVGQG